MGKGKTLKMVEDMSQREHDLANQCQVLIAEKEALLEALEKINNVAIHVGDIEMSTLSFNHLTEVRALIEKHRGESK